MVAIACGGTVMDLRKIALMHRLFGASEGHTCRECSNFTRGKIHSKTFHKCTVYGFTNSEATDWAGRWQACGAFNQTIGRPPIMREVISERKQHEADNTPIDGQISLEGI